MCRRAASVAVSCALLATTTDALAEEPTTRRWYGYENLVCDGAALALGSLGAGVLASNDDGAKVGIILLGAGLGALAGATYSLCSPIVHLAHRRPAIAAASFGMRLLPGVAVLALQEAGVVPVVVTTGAVAVAAVAVDDFALARESRPAIAFAFTFAPVAGGATLVLGSRF